MKKTYQLFWNQIDLHIQLITLSIEITLSCL